MLDVRFKDVEQKQHDRRLNRKRKDIVMNKGVYLLCLVVGLCGTGCSTTSRVKMPSNTYEYAAQVSAMPSCSAKVAERAPCYARLVTTGGCTVFIGSPGAGPEVARFVGTLEKGKTYRLPYAFMEFRKDQRKKPNQ